MIVHVTLALKVTLPVMPLMATPIPPVPLPFARSVGTRTAVPRIMNRMTFLRNDKGLYWLYPAKRYQTLVTCSTDSVTLLQSCILSGMLKLIVSKIL